MRHLRAQCWQIVNEAESSGTSDGIYISGRNRDSVVENRAAGRIEAPDAIVINVGKADKAAAGFYDLARKIYKRIDC